MQAHRLGAVHGWNWIRDGFALFKRQPFSIMSVALAMMVVTNVCLFWPMPGILVLPLLMPGLSVSSMYACRAIEQGRFARPSLLIAAFREPAPAGTNQFKLGAVFLSAIIIGVMGVATMVALLFGAEATTAVMQAAAADPTAERPMVFWWILTMCMVTMAIVTIAFWFAPVLVAWHRLPVRKAVFFGVVAALRCLPALIVFMMLATAMSATLSLALGTILDALSIEPSLQTLIAVPFEAVTSGVLMCAIYVSYRDAFGVVPAETAEPTPGE